MLKGLTLLITAPDMPVVEVLPVHVRTGEIVVVERVEALVVGMAEHHVKNQLLRFVGEGVERGGEVHQLPGFVDRLSQGVLEMGGRVEVVGGPPARRLAALGSVAALLRY